MVSRIEELTIVLVVVTVVSSGIAGVAVGAGSTATTPQADAQDDEFQTSLECATTPPEDGADPDSDVMGWENGVWYDESIDVDQSDGVQQNEQEAIISRTMARVEAVRCIEFNQSVPVTVISREQFQNQQMGQSDSEGFRAFDNAKFEALMLINESANSLEVQRRNRGTNVLGFYSPRTDEIVVIAESTETLRIDELTLAHELMHAWQDQQYDLAGTPFTGRLRDQVNARNGIVEGDASYTEELYRAQCSEGWNCLEGRTQSPGQLANMGVYLMKYQPYSDGPAFVRMAEKVGGWDAVNSLYRNLPNSTEQIIHPQRYDVDEPTNVTLNDTAGDSWSRVTAPNRPNYGELGEAALMAMFIYPYYDSNGQTNVVPPTQWLNRNETGQVSAFDPINYESPYSIGWDGDRLHAYENESGELGYVWKLAWDSPQDAQQFVEGYQEVLRYWGGEQVGPRTWRIPDGGFADAFYVSVEDTTVTIVNAPTVEQLSQVRSGIDVSATGDATEQSETTTTNEAETTTTDEAETTTATETVEATTTESDGPADSETIQVEANETTTTTTDDDEVNETVAEANETTVETNETATDETTTAE